MSSSLDDVNETFHSSYGEERDSAARDSPLFIVVGDVLTVVRDGERHEHPFVPQLSHVIKVAAHAPVALFALLYRAPAAAESPPPALRALAARIEGALEGDVPSDVRDMLETTRAFAKSAQTKLPSRTDLEAFARDAGPKLVALTEHATRLQLASLDALVDKLLADLDADEKRTLSVVVAGDHQARQRNLGMQYFEKRLGKSGRIPERVTYAEGVTSVDEAIALVGTQRFDVVLAKAFFGDGARLQRDVLGDAVAEQLRAAGRHWQAVPSCDT